MTTLDEHRLRRATVVIPLVLAGLSMLGPFSIDTPFPAFQQMGDDLDVTSREMQLVVSTYLLAFGLMSPFHGPLSDAVGRRPVIVGGVGVYVLASIGCAFSTSLPMLLAFRVLQGLSAGGGVIVGRTVIRDVFDGPEAQRLMSRVMLLFGLAPAVAPLVGGGLLQVGSWRAIFWFMVVVGLLLIVLVLTTLPETHPPERRQPLALRPLLGNLARVASSVAFHRVSWAASLSFGAQFIYIGSAPIFAVQVLRLGELEFWKLFAPMIAGVMLGSVVSSRAAGRLSAPRLITLALGFTAGAAALNVLLALIPGTSAALPWAVVGPSLLALGTASAYPSLQLTLLDMFPATRGAVTSMFTFFTLMLNAASAALLGPLVADGALSASLAALGLVLAGLAFWCWHLSSVRRAPTTAVPDPVEPTESL